ncbi:UNVERIFIED_CONTAM: hypothetical protein Scaly_2561600 [Sesamum calycinum]|uniref:Uncharacterized protein n=1 Tax=Sesamum calycinum TaxID=2727403 RepID=A0AAW2KEC0_9LAMI
MYNKNLPMRAGLTPEFKDGDYFEAPSIPQVSEESTSAGHVEKNYPQWGDEQHMDLPQRMVFDVTGPRYFASPHKGVLDDGTRSCPMDVGPSSYCYGGGPYDYDKSGLANYFSNVVHVADHPLWDGCTQSQSSVVAKYMPITPRLQRLYSSRATVEHVTWHATHQTEKGSKCHPSDTEAWKHFNRMYPDFIEEPCNIRLDLCIDSFAPHAYGMGFGWSTVGVMRCSVRMDDTRAFHPQHGDQILDRISNISPTDEMPLSLSDGYGSDHKWMKRSIFLDLPY